jgi:hypothetical protein
VQIKGTHNWKAWLTQARSEFKSNNDAFNAKEVSPLREISHFVLTTGAFSSAQPIT